MNNLTFLLSILASLAHMSLTLPSTDNRYNLVDKEEYDLEYETTECPCKNGGICALDNDFCVCPVEFTGRHCELNVRVDTRLGCGKILNNEEEYLECSKCKCSRNILTCVALTTPTCNLNVFMSKVKTEKIEGNPKGSNLLMLLKLMSSIENYAYQFYINLYKSRYGYDAVYVNINEETFETNSDKLLINLSNDRNQMIVYKTDNNQRLVGIYFKNNAQENIENDHNNLENNSNTLKFCQNPLFTFICVLFIHFFKW